MEDEETILRGLVLLLPFDFLICHIMLLSKLLYNDRSFEMTRFPFPLSSREFGSVISFSFSRSTFKCCIWSIFTTIYYRNVTYAHNFKQNFYRNVTTKQRVPLGISLFQILSQVSLFVKINFCIIFLLIKQWGHGSIICVFKY